MKQVSVKYNDKVYRADYWTLDELKSEQEFYDSLTYLGVGYDKTTNDKYDLYYDYEGDCLVASPYKRG